ncbi:hypothetical protein EVAR_97943_1 [Eumeta japonica]|uniref:Secreted protein n=1 Tax=Eumeta variegata TaxID=151549 RepID=A0A4C1XYP1_EUMVA|nr:hypothetical protein EVAR_97943_1 [Eumeta japonica]
MSTNIYQCTLYFYFKLSLCLLKSSACTGAVVNIAASVTTITAEATVTNAVPDSDSGSINETRYASRPHCGLNFARRVVRICDSSKTRLASRLALTCSGGATPLVDVGDIRREAVGGRRRRRRLAPPLLTC